jgi:hypothetical protein
MSLPHCGGVAWADYGADGTEAQWRINRLWLGQFGRYLPSVRTSTRGCRPIRPRRRDVARGVGWAAIASRAYKGEGDGRLRPRRSRFRAAPAADAGSRCATLAVRDAADPANARIMTSRW